MTAAVMPPHNREEPASQLAESALELAQLVLDKGPVSRAELAKELKLSVASLTRLSKPLLDRGLLVEGELISKGTVGRPMRLLDVRAESAYFVGLKVTGSLLQAVLVDMKATVIAHQTRSLTHKSVEAVVDGIAEIVGDLSEQSGHVVKAVGVSLGGQVKPDGVVYRAPFLDWNDVPLGEILAAKLGLPVVVDNDVTALAAAEQSFGAGRSTPNFVVITVGAGVGYGLVIRDQVVRTPDAGLGLGGHFPLDPSGPLCIDGHRGCSTAMLSIPSLCAQISAAVGYPVDYAQALDLADQGNGAAVTVFAGAGRALGAMAAAAANLTMVNTVVLGGEGIEMFERTQSQVRNALEAGRDKDSQPVELVVRSADFTDWARGAAAVAIQEVAFIF